MLPARPNDGADVSRGQVAALIDADDGNERFLACTLYARTGPLRDLVYVHAKVGIVDDRWLTIGSANLNEHSMFNDSEVNIVSLDPQLARGTRARAVGRASRDTDERSTATAPGSWTSSGCRSRTEQLERLEPGDRSRIGS